MLSEYTECAEMIREYINAIPTLLLSRRYCIRFGSLAILQIFRYPYARNERYQLDPQLSCHISAYGSEQQVNAHRIKRIAS